MARFDKAIALARRLINKNGELVWLRKLTPGAAPDPEKPWRQGDAAEDAQQVRAAFLPLDPSKPPTRYADGTTSKAGDIQVFLAADGLAWPPDVGHTFERWDGSVWVVKHSEPLDPNGQAIFFTMWATR